MIIIIIMQESKHREIGFDAFGHLFFLPSLFFSVWVAYLLLAFLSPEGLEVPARTKKKVKKGSTRARLCRGLWRIDMCTDMCVM